MPEQGDPASGASCVPVVMLLYLTIGQLSMVNQQKKS